MTNVPFVINAGEKKVLLATFADSNGISHPLSSVPVAECATKEIALEPVGTFAVDDPQFSWKIAAGKKAAPGAVTVQVHAKNLAGEAVEGKIDGTVTNLLVTIVNLRVDG